MRKLDSTLYYFACVCGIIIVLLVFFAINLWPVFHKYHSIGYSDIYELNINNFIPDIKLNNYQKFLNKSESVISTNIRTLKKHLKTVPYGFLTVTVPWVTLEKTENILSEWNITYDSSIQEYVISNQDGYTEAIKVTENSDLQYSLRINLSSFTRNKNKNNSEYNTIYQYFLDLSETKRKIILSESYAAIIRTLFIIIVVLIIIIIRLKLKETEK